MHGTWDLEPRTYNLSDGKVTVTPSQDCKSARIEVTYAESMVNIELPYEDLGHVESAIFTVERNMSQELSWRAELRMERFKGLDADTQEKILSSMHD